MLKKVILHSLRERKTYSGKSYLSCPVMFNLKLLKLKYCSDSFLGSITPANNYKDSTYMELKYSEVLC